MSAAQLVEGRHVGAVRERIEPFVDSGPHSPTRPSCEDLGGRNDRQRCGGRVLRAEREHSLRLNELSGRDRRRGLRSGECRHEIR